MKTKKFAAISAFVLLLCLSLTACAAPAPGVSFRDKTATIVLAENPTTGYTWALTVDDPAVISLKEDQYFSGGHENTAGAGGVHQYVFEAKGPGSAVVSFELGQQWEGGEKGAETKTYRVTVGENGKISSLK